MDPIVAASAFATLVFAISVGMIVGFTPNIKAWTEVERSLWTEEFFCSEEEFEGRLYCKGVSQPRIRRLLAIRGECRAELEERIARILEPHQAYRSLGRAARRMSEERREEVDRIVKASVKDFYNRVKASKR